MLPVQKSFMLSFAFVPGLQYLGNRQGRPFACAAKLLLRDVLFFVQGESSNM